MVFMERFFISTLPSFTTSLPFILLKDILSNNTCFRLASIWKSMLRGTSTIPVAAVATESVDAASDVEASSAEAVMKSFRLK